MSPSSVFSDIELILSDVDGVLSDGGIFFDNQGIEMKKFHIRDGLGIKIWQKAGYRFGILTGRTSQIVKLRAAELGVTIVRQGFEDKLPVARQVMEQLKLEPAQVCYIGDDLTDIAVIRHVGLGAAVSNAVEEVRRAADYLTTCKGGKGAVRELIEKLLKAKGRWQDLVHHYDEDRGLQDPITQPH